MAVDSRYVEWAATKQYKSIATEVKKVLLSELYWKKMSVVVDITEHVFKVLRLLDSDKPTMGWV